MKQVLHTRFDVAVRALVDASNADLGIGRGAWQKLHHADGAPQTMGRLLEARLLEALRRHHQIVEAVFVRILLEDADDALELGLILLAVGVLDDRSAAMVFASHLRR